MTRALVTDRESAAAYARWHRQHTKLFGNLQAEEPRHGTRQRYRRGCTCDPCRDANAQYSDWYRNRNRHPEMVTPKLPVPRRWVCQVCGRRNDQRAAFTCTHTPLWVAIDAAVAASCRAMTEAL